MERKWKKENRKQIGKMKQTNSEIKRGMIRATKKDRMENRE